MPSDETPEVRTAIEPLGHAGRLARVTVHNPARLNVVDSNLIRQLITAFRTLGGEHELRCVVLTGSGSRAFIGGADIRELAELSHETTHPFISRLHLACAGHPPAAGAGHRPHTRLLPRRRGRDRRLVRPPRGQRGRDLRHARGQGGIPSVIEAALLPRLIGAGRTRELVYTGEPISAAEAERWGLVERVVPAADLDAATARWVDAIAAAGPAPSGCRRRWSSGGETLPLDHAIQVGIRSFTTAYHTDEPRERMQAFLDRKRG